MMALVRVENSRSRPRSSVTLATTATRIAGTAAITENSATMRTCSRAAARPRRRACTTSQTSRAMTPSSRNTVSALISSSVTTTSWVGAIGVRSASTTKVTKADSSASPAAIGPEHADRAVRPRARRFRRARPDPRWRCLSSGPSSPGGKPSLADAPGQAPEADPESAPLMLLYNNVAELRQFLGVGISATLPGLSAVRCGAGRLSRWCGSPGCPGRGSSCAACCG